LRLRQKSGLDYKLLVYMGYYKKLTFTAMSRRSLSSRSNSGSGYKSHYIPCLLDVPGVFTRDGSGEHGAREEKDDNAIEMARDRQ